MGNKRSKTLYVSDLDGTLLRSDQRISGYSCSVINSLVEKGMKFTYATARSIVTAEKVTEGLNAAMPLIVYNGVFVIDNLSRKILCSNFFTESQSWAKKNSH
ncbi:MAG TPA: HAD hydrolase family protein [Clostridiaceae bacterium]|nr:HAD hydrolase family protein [Clostridiaceae bacterium]